ncbi:MAG: YdeI/OmpD-associated family protein [Flavobacteriales bacterium]
MKKSTPAIAEYTARSRADWRNWLSENHLIAQNLYLVIYRKSSPSFSMSVDEAIDEALCFGWIDSTPKKRDEESYCILFARRNPKSNWSAVNKKKIAKLTKAGLMEAEGIRMVKLAKKSGTWTALDEVEKGIVPPDLLSAFSTNKKAREYWDKFPPSVKRGILEWIGNAKRPETRAARIKETVTSAEVNIRANFPRQPKNAAG